MTRLLRPDSIFYVASSKSAAKECRNGSIACVCDMHVLQLSVLLCFVPAACLAFALERWVGAGILSLNVATSLIANRASAKEGERFDWIDRAAILLWGMFNLHLVIEVIWDLRSDLRPVRLALLTCALIFAGASALLDVLRRRHQFRSESEIKKHALMHATGGAGTICLLVAHRG